eukprot:5273221-Amphidinium_carterae.1
MPSCTQTQSHGRCIRHLPTYELAAAALTTTKSGERGAVPDDEGCVKFKDFQHLHNFRTSA